MEAFLGDLVFTQVANMAPRTLRTRVLVERRLRDCDVFFLMDVPGFELGNRNAERIRCFILGFQVAQRLAAWQNTRYGGGL
jgi:hypothetical protein